MHVCMHMGIRRGLTYQWSVDPDFGGGGHNWWVWLGRGHNPLAPARVMREHLKASRMQAWVFAVQIMPSREKSCLKHLILHPFGC